MLSERISRQTHFQPPQEPRAVAPLFVKLNEQIEGLTYLLTLGVRVLTVTEFVLRRSLEHDQVRLPGLHPENKRRTDAHGGADSKSVCGHFADDHTRMPPVRHSASPDTLVRSTEAVLQRLGLGAALYGQLEIQDAGVD